MKKLINFFKSLFNKKPIPKSTKSAMQDVSDRLEAKVNNNTENSKNVNNVNSGLKKQKNKSIIY